jgi:hypothetical protein
MKNVLKLSSAIAIIMVGIISVSCYEEFDPKSYQPAFTISGFTSSDGIQAASMVAYWSFDGTLEESVSGEVAENSGTTFVNGFKGKAIDLNVANKSYLTYEPQSSITGLQSFTISFWVNPTFIDADNNGGIDGVLGLVNLSNPAGFWGNIDWFVENNNPGTGPSNNQNAAIRVHVQGGETDTWIEVNSYPGLFGAWSNHTVTYDAGTSTFKYYINGSSKATTTSSWGGGNRIYRKWSDGIWNSTISD